MEARLVEADLAVHLLVLAYRAVEARFIPLSTMQDALTLLSLLVVGTCRLSGTGLRRRLPLGRAIRAACYLISAVAVALSMLGGTPPGMPPELRSLMLPVHVAGAIAAYACFTLNFVLCGYLVMRGRRRDQSAEGPDCADALARRFALLGWLLYAVFVMGGGMVWARIAWGRFWGWDPKETVSLVAFSVYSLYAYFEVVIRPRSRIFRGVLAAVACATVVATVVIGVRAPGLHSTHQRPALATGRQTVPTARTPRTSRPGSPRWPALCLQFRLQGCRTWRGRCAPFRPGCRGPAAPPPAVA